MPALTEAIKTDLYRFFAVAFNAAPGTVYMGQLVDAVVKGDMTTQRVVEEFTTKSQFTDIYPTFMSNADFAAKLVDNVVGTAASNGAKADAASQIVAALAAGDSRGKVIFTIFSKLAGLSGDATWGGVATQLANQVKAAQYYTEMLAGNSTDPVVLRSVIANAATSMSSSMDLRVGMDNLTGSLGADNFNAYVVNNANSLESGDMINGGAGADSLRAVLGSSADFAITPRTSGVEAVFIRAQSTDTNGSSGENNVNAQTGNKVTVDAQDMVGVTQWHNENSRADLKIEDVRILDSQITRDITIRMADTDPGSIFGVGAAAAVAVGNGVTNGGGRTDYEVYFSPESLRAAPAIATNVVTLAITPQLEVSRGFVAATPLLNVPYNQLTLLVNGTAVTLTIDLTGVTTYAGLETALRAGLASNPATANITLVRNAGAENFFSRDGQARVGDNFTLTLVGGTLREPTTNGWSASAGLPNDNSFGARMDNGIPTQTAPLITSTIILDNVGRESEAGALVIGSMSTRTGVERFEITVDNNDNTSGKTTTSGSWVGSLSSTNNVLQEVTAVNGVVGTSGPDYLYIGRGPQTGNDLVAPRAAPGLLTSDGMTDVRLFDASAMTGVVRVGAQINTTAIAKYQNLVDTNPADGIDNVSFVYSTGSAGDSINLAISGAAAASQTVSGRHDFTFAVNGNGGNDRINVQLVSQTGSTTDPAGISTSGPIGNATLLNPDGGRNTAPNWYSNQAVNNNVTIDGGAGNDTITKPGAGNTNILGGAGDDTVYTENTGARAQFVFNNAPLSVDTSDLRGDIAGSLGTAAAPGAVNAQLRVNYGGLLSAVVPIGGSVGSAANVAITDLTINQAIKDAINNDPVLNKLLSATDGPGRTLLVTALTDGADSAAGLSVVFSTATASAGQIASGTTQFNAATGFATLTARYVTETTTTTVGGVTTLNVGSNGTATTDNTITGGAGNDVIVLSTNEFIDDFTSSNEVVVLSAGFGTDTIVNYDSAGPGIDYINVSALGTTVTTAPESTAAAGNDTEAKVAALFAATTNAAVSNIVYMAVNTTANTDGTLTNSAKVYSVVDPAGAGTATATFQGTLVFDAGVNIQTGLNFATTAPVARALTIGAPDTGNANIGGTSGNDTVVLRGAYGQGVYATAANTTFDAAGRDLFQQALSGGATASRSYGVNPLQAGTGNIDLGGGSDTLVTYGNIDLTTAVLTSVETITANSGLKLNASQLASGNLTVQFVGNVQHRLVIVNDLTTGSINLGKIVLAGGELLLNTGGTATVAGSGIVDSSSTGNAWITNQTFEQLQAVAPVATTTANNTAAPTTEGITVVGSAPTGTGGGTGGGVPG